MKKRVMKSVLLVALKLVAIVIVMFYLPQTLDFVTDNRNRYPVTEDNRYTNDELVTLTADLQGARGFSTNEDGIVESLDKYIGKSYGYYDYLLNIYPKIYTYHELITLANDVETYNIELNSMSDYAQKFKEDSEERIMLDAEFDEHLASIMAELTGRSPIITATRNTFIAMHSLYRTTQVLFVMVILLTGSTGSAKLISEMLLKRRDTKVAGKIEVDTDTLDAAMVDADTVDTDTLDAALVETDTLDAALVETITLESDTEED